MKTLWKWIERLLDVEDQVTQSLPPSPGPTASQLPELEDDKVLGSFIGVTSSLRRLGKGGGLYGGKEELSRAQDHSFGNRQQAGYCPF
ncbi:MAG: hypothetical protein M2R45_00131 [Verrucomicrobia subdivision 3 bacterium]|nr:hypothetical protein [Limisphaerales bacterium]MCS1412409.1 hypothetical protein [Limisphaerales bacterium]